MWQVTAVSIYTCISSLAGLQRRRSPCSVKTTGVDAMFLASLPGELLVDLPLQPHRAALSHLSVYLQEGLTQLTTYFSHGLECHHLKLQSNLK